MTHIPWELHRGKIVEFPRQGTRARVALVMAGMVKHGWHCACKRCGRRRLWTVISGSFLAAALVGLGISILEGIR